MFVQWDVSLSGLVYVGEEIPKERRLASNTLIFSFAEGYYTSYCSIVSEELKNHIKPPTESFQLTINADAVPSYRTSYSLLTLTSIQDIQIITHNKALEVQELKEKIGATLNSRRKLAELQEKITKAEFSVKFFKCLITKRRAQMQYYRNRINQITNEIYEHNSEMSQRLQMIKEDVHSLNMLRNVKLTDSCRKLNNLLVSILTKRASLCKELFTDIYTITPFPGNQGYSICGVNLPASPLNLANMDSKSVSVALGYVSHLVCLIATLLGTYLSYPVSCKVLNSVF